MRRLLSVLLAIIIPAGLFAQSYNITVKLQEDGTGEPVGFATVSVSRGSEHLKYALSDKDGKAVIENVRSGEYTFKAEIMGFETYSSTVKVEKSDLDLGTVKLKEDRQMLDAASVSAVGNPIIIKKDTVEYNASAYKLSDNDVLEDLLKKLPGVEIDESGNITANGETITKITIDGKTFFLDDPQLASKNLPAKIVEKVKVVKKKSEQAEFTGIDDGEDETVIDLSVRKGMMNGVFGNAMAGGGHDIPGSEMDLNDWRFQGSAMVGRFTEDSQLSLILNGNNTNNRGFNDMSSSMMSALGGGGMGSGGRGLGRGSNGVVTSWMGGVNGSWDLFDDKMDLGANYLYNGSNTVAAQDTYKETYLSSGSTLISDTRGSSDNNTWGHRFGMRMEHKFSENTSILFQPQFSIGGGDYVQDTRFTTLTEDETEARDSTNKGFSHTDGLNKNFSTYGFFLFRQRLGMPGRTISANASWNVSRNGMNGKNQSVTETFDGADPALVNQFIRQNTFSSSLSGRLVYTEPLGADFYLEGAYEYRRTRSTSVKDTYDDVNLPYTYSVADATMLFNETGMTLNETYSNEILNRSVNHTPSVAFMYQHDKIRAQLGLAPNITSTYNTTNGVTYEDKNRLNWAPRAMLFYDFTDNANVRLFYFGRSGQPSTSQLMPVRDNSNPLAVSLGNPYLTPYFTHRLRSDLDFSNKETFFSMRLHVEGNYNANPIVSALWYDNAGVQYTFPVNGSDTYSGSVRMVINAPIAKSGFSLMNVLNTSYSRTGSYIYDGPGLDMDKYFDAEKNFDYTTFHADYPTLKGVDDFIDNVTQTLSVMERFRATYRSDNVEVMAGGRMRMSKPWYTVTTVTANTTFSNQANASFKWTVGDTGLELSTDADYNWYVGYSTPVAPQLIWNASVSKLVFHNMGTIQLKAYDMLNQSSNFSVTDTANYHEETFNTTLGRYVILSFTMRFGNFGKAGSQMRARMGGGPGGRPPMGRF